MSGGTGFMYRLSNRITCLRNQIIADSDRKHGDHTILSDQQRKSAAVSPVRCHLCVDVSVGQMFIRTTFVEAFAAFTVTSTIKCL
jgi:hypothetical protein